jgi:hypothetical protein
MSGYNGCLVLCVLDEFIWKQTDKGMIHVSWTKLLQGGVDDGLDSCALRGLLRNYKAEREQERKRQNNLSLLLFIPRGNGS